MRKKKKHLPIRKKGVCQREAATFAPRGEKKLFVGDKERGGNQRPSPSKKRKADALRCVGKTCNQIKEKRVISDRKKRWG